MATTGGLVAAAAALATQPPAVELLEPARARAAAGAGETAPRRARLFVVEDAPLSEVVEELLAGLLLSGLGIEGGRGTEDVVHDDVDTASAGGEVVEVEVVVGAHYLG